MAKVTLYHKQLKSIIEVSDRQAKVLKKSGWTEEVPKKYAEQEQSNEKEESK